MGRREVDHRVDVRFAAAFCLLATVLLSGAAGWIWSVRDRLPSPIARHWSGGQADGFSELPAILAMSVGLPMVVVVPLALGAALSRSPLAMRRCLGATSMFLLVFLTVLFVDSIRVQLDLADASSARPPNAGLAAGLLLGLVGVVAAFALIRDRPEQVAARTAVEPPPPDAPRLAEVPHLPWEAAPSGVDTAAAVTLGAAVVILVALVPLAGWPLLLLVPPLVAVGGLFGRSRVVVDARGFEARALGRRFMHVPLAEVAAADVVEVDPFWEFGGWGLRVDVAGREGLITRKGPAVRIRRGDRSEVLVTVEDAATAAALLNTLADRRDPSSPPERDRGR